MKITIISPFFPYPKRGNAHGAERYIENLAIHLKKNGQDVKIVTSFWNGGKRHDDFNGIPILRVLDSKAIFGKLGCIFFLQNITFGLSVCLNFKFFCDSDIIITNIAMGFTRFFKIKKIPFVSVFYHREIVKSFRYEFFYYSFFLFFLHYLQKRQFRKHENIIAISNFSKNELIKHYGLKEKRITVIPIGIDTEKFNQSNNSNDVREKYGKNILLYSALTVYRKRLPVLLEAMTRVIKEVPDVRLILTGGGPLWNHCKNFSDSLGLQEYVTFLGFVKDEELRKYYASSDIYILPSELEGFSQVLLEAMASGTPVICANIPPMSEIVENGGGKMFKVNDPKDLSKKIIELLKNREELLKLKKNALITIKKYEWPQIAKIYRDFFKKILKSL